MYVLITYDVATTSAAGARRLNRVAKLCSRYGQRVQDSVYECEITPGQYAKIKHELEELCEISEDSVRLYNLGKNWAKRVEHIGAHEPYNPDDPMVV